MLERPVLSDRASAVEALKSYIADGGYTPGDRLPPERELMVSLGMGRTLLRRGLDTLEREGAIWRHVGKGTFISGNAGSPTKLSELSQQVSPMQMMRARLSLEPALAREAAMNASNEAVVRIKLTCERALAAPTWEEYEAQDDAFHRSIAEATDNVLLLAMYDQLNQVHRAVAWNTVVRKTERPPRDHTSFAEHAAIASAIEARAPAAAHAAMRTHLGSVAARLFGEI